MNLFKPFVLAIFVSVSAACTSLGHEDRAIPQVEKRLSDVPKSVALVGSGELSIALEKLLVTHGVKVYASPVMVVGSGEGKVSKVVADYVINVTSVDQDMCVPEGSRQMHFYISVVDIRSNERMYAMSGDYGCKDTIAGKFANWFFQ